MKFIIKTILIALLGWLIGTYLPFWSLAVVAFVVSIIIRTSVWMSFLAGFIAIFGLWSLIAWNIDYQTQSILTERIAQIFMGIPNVALILITGFIGGLVGGLGAASGAALAGVNSKKSSAKYYH